jgi:hypothetical protein
MAGEVHGQTDQLLQQATIALGPKIRNGSELPEIQGALGEAIVKLAHPDMHAERVLEEWKRAGVSRDVLIKTEPGEGDQANIPDWLTTDGAAGSLRIGRLFEVKAVTSDAESIDSMRNQYRLAWPAQFRERVDEAGWGNRMHTFIRPASEKMYSQMQKHIKRLQLLIARNQLPGVAGLTKDFGVTLYVPEGQDFGRMPTEVTVPTDGSTLRVPLEIEKLPTIRDMQNAARKLLTNPDGVSKSALPADVVKERTQRMLDVYEQIRKLSGAHSLSETDDFIIRLITGHDYYTSNNMLRVLGSTAPSLAGDFSFRVAAEKKHGLSNTEKQLWLEYFQRHGVDEAFLPMARVVLNMKANCARKGMRIPDTRKTIQLMDQG